MFKIGCHLSASKGYLSMAKEAVSIGANTFQFFTRNPRGAKAKAIDPEDIAGFLRFSQENDISTILAHAPYTFNLCSAKPDIRSFTIETMLDDLRRMELTPGNMYNLHPGSHVGQGIEEGIRLISEALNKIISPGQSTKILLETMSGKGSEMGGSFTELRRIIDAVALSEHLGVCLDTCHVYDAGYDIVNNLEEVLEEFDKTIGLSRLCAVHINDSMNPFESHKDRHQKLGQGYIGLDAMEKIINHPALRRLPFYLETPNELAGYAEEIALLKNMYGRNLI